MKNISLLIGGEVGRQVKSEVDTLKQTLEKEKKDFATEHTPLQPLKKEKKDFVRRFEMYLIYTDMNRRYEKTKGT